MKPFNIRILDTIIDVVNRQQGVEIKYTTKAKRYCFSSDILFDVKLKNSKGEFETVEWGLTQKEFVMWLSGLCNGLYVGRRTNG